MSSPGDLELQRALSLLRALEPPSNGFEGRLRGSLLAAAANPASCPRRAPPRAAPPPRLRLWRKRPLAVLSVAALSLAGAAAAFRGQSWAPWQRSEPARTALEPAPEPSRSTPERRSTAPSEASLPAVPPAPALPAAAVPAGAPSEPPVAEGVPTALPPAPAVLERAPELGRTRPGAAPAHDSLDGRGSKPARELPRVVVPRFDLSDLPARGAERAVPGHNERVQPAREHVPGASERGRILDELSEARERTSERRRALDRARSVLEPPPALERERRGIEARDREREREPEEHESEAERGRR